MKTPGLARVDGLPEKPSVLGPGCWVRPLSCPHVTWSLALGTKHHGDDWAAKQFGVAAWLPWAREQTWGGFLGIEPWGDHGSGLAPEAGEGLGRGASEGCVWTVNRLRGSPITLKPPVCDFSSLCLYLPGVKSWRLPDRLRAILGAYVRSRCPRW